VRQRCPLAPYRFFIIGEVLNHVVEKANNEGNLRGVTMLGNLAQQIVAQYVDDTSFLVKGHEDVVRTMTKVLKHLIIVTLFN
jgi:hypothetical protein